jgi:imidazolonepropionase-like amidohydrolase
MRDFAILAVGFLSLIGGVSHGEVISITGGTLIDGTGRKPVEKAAVVIEQDRIVYAGSQAEAPVTDEARTDDASGKFLVPGFADMHNHLADGRFDMDRHATSWWGPLHPAKNLRCLLARGVTTVFNPDIDIQTFIELKRLSRERPTEYPNFFGTGPSFAAEGGHGARMGNAPVETEPARARVRELKAAGVDAIKLHYTDLTYVTKQPRPMLEREIMVAVIDEAHRQGLKAYVHAPILAYAKEVLEAGADGLVHGIISDPIDEEFVALMQRNRATYVTTHSIFYSAADLGAWAQRVAAFERSELIPKALIEVGAQEATVAAWEQRWDNLAWLRGQLPVLRDNTKAGILKLATFPRSSFSTSSALRLAAVVLMM